MKIYEALLAGLATIGVASALTVGPVRLFNNNLYINYTKGASPKNSLLECPYELQEEEEVVQVSWVFWDGDERVGTYNWYPAPEEGTATGRLTGVVNLTRNDGGLQLTQLSYNLSGDYSCGVTLTDSTHEDAAKWQVLIIDSGASKSSLDRKIEDCKYINSYTTDAMFPPPSVRAGLFSLSREGFYKEISSHQWLIHTYENDSVSYSYSDISLEIDAQTPRDTGFLLMVGVTKSDGNYIPVVTFEDKDIMLRHLGCPDPRVQEYQQVEYHTDALTCRGEHIITAQATVSCKKGFHADGDVDSVNIACVDETYKWIAEDGHEAEREDLKCVYDDAPSSAWLSATLLGVSLLLHKLL